MQDTLNLIQEYVLPHWPFVFMSFGLGMVGQFMKTKVWTWNRARRHGGFWRVMHDTMGLHAPLAGFVAGLIGFPVSPGVEGALAGGLYHFVAGAMAAWTVAAWKHFMQSRGIVLEPLSSQPPIPPDIN